MPNLHLSSSPPPPKCPRDYSSIAKRWWEKKREEKSKLTAELSKLKKKEEQSAKLQAKLEKAAKRQSELTAEALVCNAANHQAHLNEVKAKHRAELVQMECHMNVMVADLKEENATITAALNDAEDDCLEKSMALEDAEHAKAELAASLEEAECKGAAFCSGGEKLHDKQYRIAAIRMVLLNTLPVIMKHTQPITRLCIVVECLFGSALFGVEVTKVVLAEVYQKYIFNEHRNTFASW
jgi:hypothetical protein